jgi:ribosomal protein S18 acetylase RimI-like enzyme
MPGRLWISPCKQQKRAIEMAVIVRPLAEQDHEIWRVLFDDYAAFYKTQVPEGGHDTVWRWIFDPEVEFRCDVVVDKAGNVIGFTQYQLMFRSLGGGKVCYLSDLYVRPDCRGSGAGRALIDHVIGFAKANGIANLRWLTQDFNHDARRLYDSYSQKSDFILYSLPIETQ